MRAQKRSNWRNKVSCLLMSIVNNNIRAAAVVSAGMGGTWAEWNAATTCVRWLVASMQVRKHAVKSAAPYIQPSQVWWAAVGAHPEMYKPPVHVETRMLKCTNLTNSQSMYTNSHPEMYKLRFGKQLWDHILNCTNPQCDYPRCSTSKELLKHHQKCTVSKASFIFFTISWKRKEEIEREGKQLINRFV